MGFQLTLVIPCYNEAENLVSLLNRCSILTKSNMVEVILVDNGSTDNTSDKLAELIPKYKSIRSIKVDKNRGYGFGIIQGLKEAKGEIIGWTHADLQTDPCDALVGLQTFRKYGTEVFVKGSRKGRPLLDVIFSVGMSIFETILLKKIFWEINAQPTLFSKNFFKKLDDPPNDFSLDLYVYHKAKLEGLSVRRFPVNFSDRLYGSSHWNINWKEKIKFIVRTINFSLLLRKKIKNGNNCT